MKKLSINIVSESEFTVQGHGVHTAFLEHVAAMKVRKAYHVVVNSKQTTDLVHVHTVGPYSWRALRRVPRDQRIITAHIIPESLVGSLVGGHNLRFFTRAYLKWFYSQAKFIVAVSEEVREALKKLGVRSHIEVIPNGVNLTTLKPSPAIRKRLRHKLSVPAERTVVISNGQIQPRKRFDTFTQAARELPNMSFVWIGGMPFGRMGSGYKNMTKLIQTAPENVIITGLLDRETALEHMQAGDIFFLPSDQENHPLAVLEAAALHLPIVLRDIKEYNTSFKDGAQLGNDQSFVKLITMASTASGQKSGKRQAQIIAARYDIQKLTDQLVKLYATLNHKS